MSLSNPTPQPTLEDLVSDLPADPGSSHGAMNAVTHGLTARRPLSEEEEQTMIVITDTWVAKHLPETAPEEALIRASAIEYVRYGRCVRAEEARLRPAAAEAVRAWREKRRHAIRKKAQSLSTDPEGTLAELLDSAFGIDWLSRHWRNLLTLLDSGKGWLANDVILSMNLLGRPGTTPSPEQVDAYRMWMLAFRACPSTFDPNLPPGGLSDDAEALDQLRALVIDRIERLELLRPDVWEANDAPEELAVESDAMVDTSKTGQLRQRYRREALSDVKRTYAMVMQIRIERAKQEGRNLRNERAAANASSTSRFDPPTRPQPAPEPAPAAPAPSGSRNEPVSSPSESPRDRPNSNPPNMSRADSAGASSLDPRRTGSPSDTPRSTPEPSTDARPGPQPGLASPDRSA